MSADVQAPELKVRFSRRDENNGGEEEEVNIYDTLEERAPDPRPHEVGPLTHSRPAAAKRRAVAATAAILGVLYLVILVGVYMRNVFVTLEKQNLQTERDELRLRLNQSETRNINVTEERDQLQARYDNLTREQTQGNSTEWKRCQCRCYYKSTEMKNWTESRRDCKNRGADLVMISSRDEQSFVSELNKPDASWIGLQPVRSSKGGWGWGWGGVDASTPSYRVWGVDEPVNPLNGSTSRAFINPDGAWGQTTNGSKRWICEKQINQV